MKVRYRPTFLRKFKKLSVEIQGEALDKIKIFKEDWNHPFLKTHKLSGRLSGVWSFSVNFSYRIIFEFEDKETVAFLTIGDHSIYK